jgi:pimeloyl-ACP methyl ester carboxylesterase
MPHFQGTESNIWFEQEGPEGAPQLVWVGGGGARGRDWQRFQTPHFAGEFRNLVFDNRGIGGTTCAAPMPWPIESFARDLAELAAAQCNGPAIFIGSSLGSAILASSSASTGPTW